MLCNTYKVARTAKSKSRDGIVYHDLIDARHGRNKLGSAYYIYKLTEGKIAKYWKHVY